MAAREKIVSLQGSLQSTNDVVSCLKTDLCTLNARFGWFKYKRGKTKHKLSATNLRVLRLEEVINDLNVKVEF